MRRGAWSIALDVALVCAVTFAISGFSRSNTHVTLVVDGQVQQVATFSDDVAAVLSESDVEVAQRDVVQPALSAPTYNGLTITVEHVRPLSLVVDGQALEMWTTATTVGKALQQVSVDAHLARLSASRRTQIPLSGIAVRVHLPHQVTVIHDGQVDPEITTAGSVAGALADADVTLGRWDLVDTPMHAQPWSGEVVTVVRVTVTRAVHSARLVPRTIRQPDPSMLQGVTEVDNAGLPGKELVIDQVIRHDGVVVRRVTVGRRIVSKPVTRVIRYGTKLRTASSPSLGDDGLNWTALAGCESGGNPRAVNPAGYYGLYQFSLSTWAAVGGSGNPIDASPREQLYRAQVLYREAGSSPWPVCGRMLYT